MSLLRRSELRAGLCPDRLIVARYRSGLRRKLVAHAIHQVDTDPVNELKKVAGAARLSVVLSNHFVRYAVLPWSATLRSAEEWAAFALHSFTATYGEVAKGWDIRVSVAGRESPALACAVDRELIASLRELPGLVSVRPHVMAAFNACRASLPGTSFWFVLQEAGRLTVSLVSAGNWRLVRHRQAAAGWQQSLADVIEREAAGCGEAGTDCVALCCEDAPPASAGRYRVLDLGTGETTDAALRPFRMALAA